MILVLAILVISTVVHPAMDLSLAWSHSYPASTLLADSNPGLKQSASQRYAEYVQKLFQMPKAVEVQPGEAQQSSGEAVAWITITAQFQDKAQWAWPMVDRRKFEKIRGHETRTFRVTPGEHEVQVGTDDFGSNDFILQLSPGETKRLICGSRLNGWKRLVLSPRYYFKPTRYFYVKEAGL
jgi:hypothetical protein